MSTGPDNGAGGDVDGAQADMGRLHLGGGDTAPSAGAPPGEGGFAPASPVVKAAGDKGKFNVVAEQPQGTEDKFKVCRTPASGALPPRPARDWRPCAAASDPHPGRRYSSGGSSNPGAGSRNCT